MMMMNAICPSRHEMLGALQKQWMDVIHWMPRALDQKMDREAPKIYHHF